MNSQLSSGLQMPPTPFWGMCVFEAESYDKIIEVLSHPEYMRRVFPDEKNLMDRSKSLVVSGGFATVFERAKL
jgi:hypothetical protein